MLTLIVWLLVSPNNLGAAAFARGDFPLAGKLFHAAWQFHPNANIASNLGAVARRLGQWTEAEHWFATVYALREKQLGAHHPDTVIALNNRGVARLALGRLPEARADFETALERTQTGTQDQAAILANLGDLALAQARLAEASRHCAQALAISPPAAHVCLNKLRAVAIAVP